MIRPMATRLRLYLALAAIAAFAVVLPATASADITNSGPSAATGSVTIADPTPGAHSDMTFVQNYAGSYSGVPSGAPGTTGDDLKQWMLDLPSGFYGNPNAVPYAERCTTAQAQNYVNATGSVAPGEPFNPAAPCPATSQVGTASLVLGVDASGGTAAAVSGKIYIVQSGPGFQDVPTTLFTVFTSTIPSGPAAGQQAVASTSRTQVAPVTSGPQGDYRLRAVSDDAINRPDLSASLGQAPGTTLGHIKQITFNLRGVLDNGNAFQTNPSRCGNWTSTMYAASYGTPGGTANQTSTVSGTAANGGVSDGGFLALDAGTIGVSCALPRPPLLLSTSASLGSKVRGDYPALTVTIDNPNSDNRDRAAKLVTKLPASVSVNINALNNVCDTAALVADSCPAASQIGSASISSPMLALPQVGRVYMTKGATPGLPYLSIWVDGAIKFRLDGTTRFVGAAFNEIETTFDTLPQLAFDKFVVYINGGSSNTSLLFTRTCPTDGSSPDNGPITFATTGWAGATVASSSPVSLDPCTGISRPSRIKNCVKVGKQLKVSPKGVIDKASIAKITLQTGSKSRNVKNRATDRMAPFKFKLTLKKSKYKSNKKYYYGYKVYYKDGNTIKTKTNTFKTCKKRR